MPTAIEEEQILKDKQKGVEQPVSGLNHLEEQYIKYGNNLGNFHPKAIVGTDSMASVYKSDNFTPAEYTKFFNYQSSGAGGQKRMMKYRPKGIDYKLHGDRFHQASVLEDKDRLVEFSRRHGTTDAGQIRNQYRPDLAAYEGNWASTFLCEG